MAGKVSFKEDANPDPNLKEIVHSICGKVIYPILSFLSIVYTKIC